MALTYGARGRSEPAFYAGSCADCRQNRIAKLDESLKKRGTTKIVSRRAGRRVAQDFIICDTDAQNFIFRVAEIMRKFRFELVRDRLRGYFAAR